MARKITLADLPSYQVLALPADLKVAAVIKQMRERAINTVIAYSKESPVGVFNRQDADVLEHEQARINELSLAEVMSLSFSLAPSLTTLAHALHTMTTAGTRYLLLSDYNKLDIRLLTRKEIVWQLYGSDTIRLFDVIAERENELNDVCVKLRLSTAIQSTNIHARSTNNLAAVAAEYTTSDEAEAAKFVQSDTQAFRSELNSTDRTDLHWFEEIGYASEDIMVLVDSRFTLLAANAAYQEAVGLNAEQLIGLTVADIYGYEFFIKVVRPQAMQCMAGMSIYYEGWFDFKGWGRRYMHVHYYPYRSRSGVVMGYVANLRDESDRKLAEEALRTSEELLRQSQKIAHIAHWTFDPITKIPWWSDELFRIHGLEPKDGPLTFKEHMQYVHPDDKEWLTAISRETAKTGKPFDVTLRIVRPDGTERIVNSICKPVTDDDGSVIELRGTIQDVTDITMLERQLAQSRKLESIGRLAGGVAHDFNNMLGVILGEADLVLENTNREDAFFSSLSQIREAASRSANLTSQLLGFARQQTATPKVIDLNEVVTGMTDMLGRLIGEEIDLVWKPSDKLWRIKFDPSQLDQILANLLVNARDAIAGIGQVSVETSNETMDETSSVQPWGCIEGNFVTLTVSDNGCGMDDETLVKLFEPFYTTKKFGESTGLGLANVYGVVKQNNGFINVISKLGQGTTFKIYLPPYTGSSTDFLPVEDVDEKLIQGTELVLVVEDEPMILEITTTMLESAGYTVVATESPSEAIKLARQHGSSINLLIADVVMPEMTGAELSEIILAEAPEIKCLFMSGYAADVITDRGVLDESTHFIQKPFPLKAFTAKVRSILDAEDELE